MRPLLLYKYCDVIFVANSDCFIVITLCECYYVYVCIRYFNCSKVDVFVVIVKKFVYC